MAGNGRECLTIHIGQTGVQSGSALWGLYCREHGVLPNGMKPPGLSGNITFSNTLFREHESQNFIPRALFIDMEQSCINQIRNGYYRKLFHPDMFVAGKEDAGNNFARGYYAIGREFNEVTMDRVRRMVEPCDGFQGFNIFRSVAGGSGSGFGAALLNKINTYYGQKSVFTFDIFPSPQAQNIIVEPYNVVLSNHANDGNVHISFYFDNKSLSTIYSRYLQVMNPTFKNLNKLWAHVVNAMTSNMRFQGTSLTEFQTSLIPFPRIRFPIVSYAPIIKPEYRGFELFNTGNLISTIFSAKNQTMCCDSRLGKYMAITLNFRGDYSTWDIEAAKILLKGYENELGKVKFVDWAPPGFKINFCDRQPYIVLGSEFGPSPRTLVSMMNNTAVAQPFTILKRKYDLMWKKRAFVHWYVAEGMEEIEFEYAHENLGILLESYTDLQGNDKCKDDLLDLTIRGVGLDYCPPPILAKSHEPSYYENDPESHRSSFDGI